MLSKNEVFERLSLGTKRRRFVAPEEATRRAGDVKDNPYAKTWDDNNLSPRQRSNRRVEKPGCRWREGSETDYVNKYGERTYVGKGCHMVTTDDGRDQLVRTGGKERLVGTSANGAIGANYSAHASVTAEKVIRRLASKRGITESQAREIVYEIGRIGQDMILAGELFGIPHVGVLYLKCEPSHRQTLKLRTTSIIRSLFDLNGQGVYSYDDAIYDARQETLSRKYGGNVKPYIPRTKKYTDKKYVIEHVPTEHGIKRRVRFLVEAPRAARGRPKQRSED